MARTFWVLNFVRCVTVTVSPNQIIIITLHRIGTGLSHLSGRLCWKCLFDHSSVIGNKHFSWIQKILSYRRSIGLMDPAESWNLGNGTLVLMFSTVISPTSRTVNHFNIVYHRYAGVNIKGLPIPIVRPIEYKVILITSKARTSWQPIREDMHGSVTLLLCLVTVGCLKLQFSQLIVNSYKTAQVWTLQNQQFFYKQIHPAVII